MSTGADNKTMPVTKEYEDGYERTFGKREPVRGKWVWDAAQQKLVEAGSYRPPEAVNAPIMAGRFYENTHAMDPEKTDIGSRTKHREYMKRHDLTIASDYTQTWAKAEAARAKIRAGEPMPDNERREQIGRVAYEVEKRARRR